MKIRLRPESAIKPRKLSVELGDLRQAAGDRAVTLREVIQVLGGRAYMLLVLLLALPFITPIPLPGLSTPFGLAIGLIAFRLSLGQRPWLPKKLQRKVLPAGFIGKVFGFAEKVLPDLPVGHPAPGAAACDFLADRRDGAVAAAADPVHEQFPRLGDFADGGGAFGTGWLLHSCRLRGVRGRCFLFYISG